MKTLKTFTIIILLQLVIAPCGWADSHLVAEPDISTQVVWNVLPNGMLLVGYDLDQNNVADFYTYRVIVRSFFSTHSPQQEAANFPTKLVFNVDYAKDFFIYIVERHPILYAIDANEDGVWDLMYKDPREDGVNGNEKVYQDFSTGAPACTEKC